MKDCGHNAKRDSNSSYCHTCYMRDYRARNREKINAYQRKRHRERLKTEPGYKEQVKAQNKVCSLKRKYGITIDEYNDLLDAAGHKCEICGNTESNGHYKSLCIDHCHETGEIRGILCDACNKQLGNVGDNLESLMRFVNYLKKGRK